MHVPALHQAEHLARDAAHLQRLAIERPGERVQPAHEIGDRPEAVQRGVRRLGLLGEREHAGVRLGDHLLAEVDADEVVLEEVVVEHVLGRFAEVHDPLRERRRLHAEGHVLRVDGARRVVVAADPADAARDEVRVPGVLALHEDAVAAEDRRGALALDHAPRAEVDLRVDPEAPDDARDRIPRHVDDSISHAPPRSCAGATRARRRETTS
jgi:hypothetical protein